MDVPSTSQAAVMTRTKESNEEESEITVKRHYMSLLDEVESIESSSVHQNISKLNDVLDTANHLFPKVKKPDHMYLDAKLVNCSSATLKDTCDNVDAGEGNFRLFKFAEQLKMKSLNSENRPSWDVLAAVAQPVVHNSLPYWSPLLGSFELQADVTLSQKKERKKRTEKDKIADKKEPEKLKSIDKTQEAVEKVVQGIYSTLKARYKRNDKRPISYFKFVINPNSFAATVENIFHVSFLINDGFVRLELDDEELVIFPVSRGKENSDPQTGQNKERIQNIFSIDMKSWRGLVAALEIKEAMIR